MQFLTASNAGSVAYIALIGALVCLALLALRGQRRMIGWPTVGGEVTESRVEGYGEGFSAEVRYRYTVQGQSHLGSRVSLTGLGPTSRSSCEAIAAKYPVGAKVEVYYDPVRPSSAYLEQSLPISFYFMLVLVVATTAVNAGLFAFGR